MEVRRFDISFVISSRGTRQHLIDLLQSIAATSLSCEVLIGCPQAAIGLAEYAKILSEPRFSLRWLQVGTVSLSELRNRLYVEATGRWVYFLDEDCRLPLGFAESLTRALRQNPFSALGGYYQSPGKRLLQRAYNSMANLWLKVHRNQVVLAGNFVLPKLESPAQHFPFSLESGFGGEEIALSQNLLRNGLNVRHMRELSVFHCCSHPPAQFVGRAILHGRSAFRPAELGSSFPILLQHLLDEKNPLVASLVLFYVLMVRVTRLGARFFVERNHNQYGAPELASRIDSYPSL